MAALVLRLAAHPLFLCHIVGPTRWCPIAAIPMVRSNGGARAAHAHAHADADVDFVHTADDARDGDASEARFHAHESESESERESERDAWCLPSAYDVQLAAKTANVRRMFDAWLSTTDGGLEVFASPRRMFRRVCTFGIHDNDAALSYALWHRGALTTLTDYVAATAPIRAVMPLLLEALSTRPALADNLATVSFLASRSSRDVVATLTYAKTPPAHAWSAQAASARTQVGAHLVGVVARAAKGVAQKNGSNHVEDTVALRNGDVFTYRRCQGAFVCPNDAVAVATSDWLCAVAAEMQRSPTPARTLLEMFCGDGNHTVALSRYFKTIIAVELDARLCAAAEENLRRNGVTHATVIAADARRFTCSFFTFFYLFYFKTRARARASPIPFDCTHAVTHRDCVRCLLQHANNVGFGGGGCDAGGSAARWSRRRDACARGGTRARRVHCVRRQRTPQRYHHTVGDYGENAVANASYPSCRSF